MDYEKKYKGALARCKWLLSEGMISKIVATDMFRELMDNDENIRKEIINIFHSLAEGKIPIDINYADIFTWLEKQRKEDSSIQQAYEYGYTEGKRIERKHWLEKQGEQEVNEPDWCHHKVDLSDCSEEYRKAYYDGWNNCNQQHSQCNAEQKPADKVESKFKVGDWVVSPNGVHWHIDAIQNGRYEVTADTGQCGNWPLDTNIYRLWTIQDAKDGDAIFYDDGWTCIFKYIHGIWYSSYCFITADGEFHTGYERHAVDSTINGNANPATKEQRNLLFTKMKEAGYEWDAEKKELKKVDVELTDFEKSLKHIMIETLECGDTHNLKADAEMLLRFAQKPAEWSEEDEKVWKELIEEVKDQLDSIPSPDCRDKEDEKALKQLTRWLVWLKSLKERYAWKPSKEQMDALNCAQWNAPFNIEILDSLYNDLKKLKGE